MRAAGRRARSALGSTYVPSHGNFVLVKVGDAGARLPARCWQQGVIVRPVANYGLPEYLRVTVGLPAENERFLDGAEGGACAR